MCFGIVRWNCLACHITHVDVDIQCSVEQAEVSRSRVEVRADLQRDEVAHVAGVVKDRAMALVSHMNVSGSD